MDDKWMINEWKSPACSFCLYDLAEGDFPDRLEMIFLQNIFRTSSEQDEEQKARPWTGDFLADFTLAEQDTHAQRCCGEKHPAGDGDIPAQTLHHDSNRERGDSGSQIGGGI